MGGPAGAAAASGQIDFQHIMNRSSEIKRTCNESPAVILSCFCLCSPPRTLPAIADRHHGHAHGGSVWSARRRPSPPIDAAARAFGKSPNLRESQESDYSLFLSSVRGSSTVERDPQYFHSGAPQSTKSSHSVKVETEGVAYLSVLKLIEAFAQRLILQRKRRKL